MEPTIWCFTTDPNNRYEFCDPINHKNNGLEILEESAILNLEATNYSKSRIHEMVYEKDE